MNDHPAVRGVVGEHLPAVPAWGHGLAALPVHRDDRLELSLPRSDGGAQGDELRARPMDGVVPRVGELGKDVEIKVHAAGHVHAKDVPFFLVLLRDRLPDSDERPWPKPRSWWE